jgi:hypothetical protein
MGIAVLRFSRDKRGYEHFYLIQPSDRRGKSGARILYWFRTPPNVRVGREPFDPAIRRMLESQYPDVTFDWKKFVDTPIPRAEPEAWRERRDAVRAARATARAETPGSVELDQDEANASEASPFQPEATAPEATAIDAVEVEQPDPVPSATVLASPDVRTSRQRRRRRRGRRSGRSANNLASAPFERPAREEPRESGEPPEPVEPHEPGGPHGSGEPRDPDV